MPRLMRNLTIFLTGYRNPCDEFPMDFFFLSKNFVCKYTMLFLHRWVDFSFFDQHIRCFSMRYMQSCKNTKMVWDKTHKKISKYENNKKSVIFIHYENIDTKNFLLTLQNFRTYQKENTLFKYKMEKFECIRVPA